MSDFAWRALKVGDIFRINTASVLPNAFPNSLFYHHSLPAWDESGGPVIEPGMAIESNKTTLKAPCVLVSKLNPRKPRVSVVENIPESQNHCASTEFVCLEPAINAICLSFWRHFFSHKQFSNRLDRVAIGSTNSHKRYSPKELLSFRIYVPPASEQGTIAQLLNTLDTQLQKTEALITKLEKIKEGLLHDLLIRGVDHNGQLRPTPEQVPELYKDSVLGMIPKTWSLTSWGTCTKNWAMGPRFSSDKYAANGNVATLRTTDMDRDGGIDHQSMPVAILNLEGFERHFLQPYDFVITRSGTCGVSGVFYGHELPVLPGAFLIRFRFNESILDPEFMSLYVNSDSGQSKVQRVAEGGVQKNIRGSSLAALTIKVPPIHEQQEIKSRYFSICQKIQNEQKLLNKLQAQKHGLMDDLLTGRVRVTPLLKDAV